MFGVKEDNGLHRRVLWVTKNKSWAGRVNIAFTASLCFFFSYFFFSFFVPMVLLDIVLIFFNAKWRAYVDVYHACALCRECTGSGSDREAVGSALKASGAALYGCRCTHQLPSSKDMP